MRRPAQQIVFSMHIQKTIGNTAPIAVQRPGDECKNGSRGQRRSPLLHVIELMLPPLSTLRAQAFCAPASATCRWILAALLGLNAMVAGVATAEEAVIGNQPGEQDFPALSIGASGGYLAFEDNRTGSGRDGRDISAVALNSELQAHGEPFRVNQLSLGKNEKPQVLTLGNGNTLFAWEVRQGSKAGIYTRVLGTNGLFTSGDTLLNIPTLKQTIKQTAKWTAHYRGKWKARTHKFKDIITNTREQAGAVSMASLPDGGAVLVYHAVRRCETNSWYLKDVVYISRGNFRTNAVLTPIRMTGDWMHDVFMQRLDAAGQKVGEEILVNQSTDFNQRTPSVATLENGNLVVAWVSESPVSSDWRANFRVDLMGRVFDAQGQPISDEFPVAAADNLIQANPVVSATTGGGFTVLWSQQEGTTTRGWDVYARSFGADASASGAAFRVNSYTTGDQFAPRIASSGGQQLVVWTSISQDGSREGVFGRVLQSGALAEPEFQVNATTVSRQYHPAVATDGQGRALTVWAGFVGAATGFDLFSHKSALGIGETGASR